MAVNARSLKCVPVRVDSLENIVKKTSTSVTERTLAIICATTIMVPTAASAKKGSYFKQITRVVRESVRTKLHFYRILRSYKVFFNSLDNNPVNEFEARDMENDIESDSNLVQHVHKLEKELARDRSRTNDLQKMLDNANGMVNNLQSRLTTLVRYLWQSTRKYQSSFLFIGKATAEYRWTAEHISYKSEGAI